MQIQYVIINFAILVAILVLAGRKTVKNIFGGRLEKINKALDEAEELEKLEMPVFETESEEIPAESISEEFLQLQAHTEETLGSIKSFGERECSEIHRHMIENARKELFSVMKDYVVNLFAYEKYTNEMKALDGPTVDAILSQICLTPGDMSYLRHHGVLYVTLTSAYPLAKELVEKVDKATTELVEKVGGKTSLWVLEDSSLIGGLKLRIGDTVYDGTVSEELYHFEKNMNHEPIMDDDTVGMLIQEFTQKAEEFTPGLHKYQLGRVISVSDGICWMDGLADIMYGEVVEFECGETGMVLDIQQNRIGCVIFGEFSHIESGSRVRRVGTIASVPVGECLLGRVVDALGTPIDAMGYLPYEKTRPIEYKAPAILDRSPVNSPMHTGIKAIDALIPIGKGQRELIIGDRQTGKTAIAIDTIINQKGKGTICIYVAIGQKETLVAEIKEKLQAKGAMDYTTIIAVPASASAALQYIAPFSGSAMAEYFMYEGKDVLIVYDDLSKHAVAYRELSLLLHRPSGREAYPGDIFYLQSRLLERSAHLSEELGGGSITALPIIETLAGDISAYIPTNVISITDGQIFLDADLFNEGLRPAVNVGLSVSRVGGAAQNPVMKKISASLRTRLAQYRELAEFMQFGSDIDDETMATLEAGKRLTEALKQARFSPITDELQTLLIYAVSEGYAKHIDVADMERFEKELYVFLEKEKAALLAQVKNAKKLDDALKQEMDKAIAEFVERF
ncbi:MAG: F0F1 ATP synthase subunit alpha [Oscillospiraceae bacterium]|nr:F0F1 ATP synthase subunit alpha [Oscillospiraceae bacterium]